MPLLSLKPPIYKAAIVAGFSFLGVLAFTQAAQAQQNSYCTGNLRSGLLNGKGSCLFPSGNRYEGEFKEGRRHGRGTLILKDGTRCEGEFREELLNGQGNLRFP
ncbi:hypothetical protein QPK87_04375 [Kamptonema cortianum]|nr:hypothetical protein [Kamptonema cortianum]